jgi:hypothetical protein
MNDFFELLFGLRRQHVPQFHPSQLQNVTSEVPVCSKCGHLYQKASGKTVEGRYGPEEYCFPCAPAYDGWRYGPIMERQFWRKVTVISCDENGKTVDQQEIERLNTIRIALEQQIAGLQEWASKRRKR